MLSGSDFDCPMEMLFSLYSSNILHTYVNCNSPVQTDSANRLHYAKQLGWNTSIFSPHGTNDQKKSSVLYSLDLHLFLQMRAPQLSLNRKYYVLP